MIPGIGRRSTPSDRDHSTHFTIASARSCSSCDADLVESSHRAGLPRRHLRYTDYDSMSRPARFKWDSAASAGRSDQSSERLGSIAGFGRSAVGSIDGLVDGPGGSPCWWRSCRTRRTRRRTCRGHAGLAEAGHPADQEAVAAPPHAAVEDRVEPDRQQQDVLDRAVEQVPQLGERAAQPVASGRRRGPCPARPARAARPRRSPTRPRTPRPGRPWPGWPSARP